MSEIDPIERLFDEWAASYRRGENPDPIAYLDRASERADELAQLMDGFLEAVPAPDASPEAVMLAEAWIGGGSPLVALRVSHGVTRDAVVDAVVEEFALAPARRAKVKRYYHELESGQIDSAGLDARLVALLERTLKATRNAILGWRPRPLAASPAFRIAEGQPMPEVAMDMAIPSPAPRDEVDELFGV